MQEIIEEKDLKKLKNLCILINQYISCNENLKEILVQNMKLIEVMVNLFLDEQNPLLEAIWVIGSLATHIKFPFDNK